MGTGSFLEVKRPGRGVDHLPSYSAEVKEEVELYLYSQSRLSWSVIGRHLPLPGAKTIKLFQTLFFPNHLHSSKHSSQHPVLERLPMFFPRSEITNNSRFIRVTLQCIWKTVSILDDVFTKGSVLQLRLSGASKTAKYYEESLREGQRDTKNPEHGDVPRVRETPRKEPLQLQLWNLGEQVVESS
jgi:hypothetical protein